MKTAIAFILLFTIHAQAAPVCTEAPKEKWQDKEKFQADLKEQGYEIKKFLVLDHCYEIYGRNKDGQRVEIYFDPVTAKIVKQEID